jgi:hypothetical protein
LACRHALYANVTANTLKRVRHINIIFGLVFGLSTLCFSQDNDSTSFHRAGDKYLSLLVGYNFWNNHFLELGLAYNQLDIQGPHAFGFNYSVSTEIKIDNDLVLGPKVGLWFSNGIGMGLNIIYYTDLDNTALRFRPEIGIGLSRFKIVYGYNIPLTNKDFEKINKSNIGLVVLFGLKKVKDRESSLKAM